MSDNPPAFPQNRFSAYTKDRPGMTLRDWFAGQAIASIPLRQWDHARLGDEGTINAWAKCAYLVADAMLAERNKT